jgi:hypothetical protein
MALPKANNPKREDLKRFYHDEARAREKVRRRVETQFYLSSEACEARYLAHLLDFRAAAWLRGE